MWQLQDALAVATAIWSTNSSKLYRGKRHTLWNNDKIGCNESTQLQWFLITSKCHTLCRAGWGVLELHQQKTMSISASISTNAPVMESAMMSLDRLFFMPLWSQNKWYKYPIADQNIMIELVTGTRCPLPESGCHSSRMQFGERYLTSSKLAPRAVSCSVLLDKPFW